MTYVTPSVSANDLAEIIKADRSAFDHTASPSAITRHLERTTQKRVTFGSLVLAMLFAGFSVAPYGKSFRFSPMLETTGVAR
ncbi:hypothetical protein [Cupriavidus plantarum]|uniref:Uncharacterized protein n=1 Tax=Cupriavidus plantarum TaxID=942865 RepID=A0A316FLY4_9BURK|nr:hypothetical protein [Cupriavidus plantarum]PWK38670.1 hypothetical protein C7419_1012569 [Cupriavidus plantarum]